MVEMDYLDPSEGWTPLLAYQGDASALETALQKAISAFHQCLDGKAVHGDLRPPNIFVREGRCVGRLLKDSISLSQRATSDSRQGQRAPQRDVCGSIPALLSPPHPTKPNPARSSLFYNNLAAFPDIVKVFVSLC